MAEQQKGASIQEYMDVMERGMVCTFAGLLMGLETRPGDEQREADYTCTVGEEFVMLSAQDYAKIDGAVQASQGKRVRLIVEVRARVSKRGSMYYRMLSCRVVG